MFVLDSKGILNPDRPDLKENKGYKWQVAVETNGEGRTGGMEEAIRGTDVLIDKERMDS